MEATPTFYSKWHISIFLHNVFSYNSKKFTQRIASSVMCKTIALFLLNCNINTEITFTGNYWKWRQNDSTVLMGFFKFQAVREICDTFTDRGLPNYPSGAPFTFWEQYINLRFYLSLAILCVLLSTFVVLTLVLVNPWLATVVVRNSLYRTPGLCRISSSSFSDLSFINHFLLPFISDCKSTYFTLSI